MVAPRAFWTGQRVAAALGLAVDERRGQQEFTRVWTDSRDVTEGDLFVALVGEHFDGHDYIESALAAGAAGVVVSDEASVASDVPTYRVADTLVAFGALAAYRRRALPAKVVGITGSSGKTTTKDLTAGAVASSLRTHATAANYNNRIGVPRTILDAPEDSEVLVVEMGTNEPGEIAALTRVAQPDVGVITTVSETHLEGLGSLEGVLHEKLALVRGLPTGGRALVGEDPAILRQAARETGASVVVAGLTEAADPQLRATDLEVRSNGAFRFTWRDREVELQIPGEVAVIDALLALGVATELGVSPEDAIKGVEDVEAAWLRGEVRSVGGLTLILDCYNANPQSVRAAARTLEAMPATGERVLVLGSMLELGELASALHRDVLAEVTQRGLDRIYVSGDFAEVATHIENATAAVVVEAGVDALGERLRSELTGDEVVLLKASRGVRLEAVVPGLEAAFGQRASETTGESH